MSITKNKNLVEASTKRKSQDCEIDDDGLFYTKKAKRTYDDKEPAIILTPSMFHHNSVCYETEILKFIKDQPEFILQNLNHNILCFQGFEEKMPVIGVLGSPQSGKSTLITQLGHFINCPVQPGLESPTGVNVYHSKVFDSFHYPVSTFLEFKGSNQMFLKQYVEVSSSSSNSQESENESDMKIENESKSEGDSISIEDEKDTAIKEYFPSLCTLISDVVIIVTTKESKECDFSLLKESCMTLSTNVKLMKKKPMLIVVHNKDNSLVDSNVKDLTEQFLKDNDSTNIIREVFENVRCISLPDIDLVGDKNIGVRWENQTSIIRSLIYEHISTNGANADPITWYQSLPGTLRRISFPFECILSHLKTLFRSLFPACSNSLSLFQSARKYTFLALSRCFLVFLLHHGVNTNVAKRWEPQLKSFCGILWDTLKKEQPCGYTEKDGVCTLRFHNHGNSHSLSSVSIWSYVKVCFKGMFNFFSGSFVDLDTEQSMTGFVLKSIEDFSGNNIPELHLLAETLLSSCEGLEPCDFHLCPTSDHSCHRCWRLNNVEKELVWNSENVLKCDPEFLLPTRSKLYFCQSCWKDRSILMKTSFRHNTKVQHNSTRDVPNQDELIPI